MPTTTEHEPPHRDRRCGYELDQRSGVSDASRCVDVFLDLFQATNDPSTRWSIADRLSDIASSVPCRRRQRSALAAIVEIGLQPSTTRPTGATGSPRRVIARARGSSSGGLIRRAVRPFDDRRHSTREVAPELLKDVTHVSLDRLHAEEDFLRDLAVRVPGA